MIIFAFEIAWLFFVLPVFDTTHRRFFRFQQSKDAPKVRYIDWFTDFVDAVRQRQAFEPALALVLSRKGLLYASLVLSFVCFYMFVEASYSPFLILAILFSLGLIKLLLGFTFEQNFVGFTSLEEVVVRQGVVLLLIVGLMATLLVDMNASLEEVLQAQMQPFIGELPSLGVYVNPVAFICNCVALSMYLRFWENDEYPSQSMIRKSPQQELFGLDLIVFRIVRNLDFLLLYSLVVFIYFGGPHWGDVTLSQLSASLIFTVQVAIVALIVLGAHYVGPRIERQALRVMLLALLPLQIASFPISVLIRQMLNVL